ncbi:MAG: hypothetical protein U9N60_07120 [Thermodesulfobacteriota bacterium]|nr:hypothetical protein [Thermodesulfobacteriota bacterium]
MQYNSLRCGFPCRAFPFLAWLGGYQKSFLRNDLIAGVTVAVVRMYPKFRLFLDCGYVTA